jgi:hypothetical protein
MPLKRRQNQTRREKHWAEYTPEEQSFWIRWSLVVVRTGDANRHEAMTAARLANEMLTRRELRETDCPELIKLRLARNNLPPLLSLEQIDQIEKQVAVMVQQSRIYEELRHFIDSRKIELERRKAELAEFEAGVNAAIEEATRRSMEQCAQCE